MTADDLARVFHAHYKALAAGSYPEWEGLQVSWRRERVAAWQSMLDAGWTFTPPPHPCRFCGAESPDRYCSQQCEATGERISPMSAT